MDDNESKWEKAKCFLINVKINEMCYIAYIYTYKCGEQKRAMKKEKVKIPAVINRERFPGAAVAGAVEKALKSAKKNKSDSLNSKYLSNTSFTSDQPKVGKNMSWYERFVNDVGIENLREMRDIMIKKAKEGHDDFLTFFMQLFYPKHKADRFMRQRIKDFLSLTDQDNYSANVGIVIEGMANGEIDLDDGALILTHLYQGTEMFFNKDINEMKDALAQIKAQS